MFILFLMWIPISC